MYLAVDKGEWQRIPQEEGTYLNGASTTMADLRQYVSLATYDQLDLEVWSGTRGEGPVADGSLLSRGLRHTTVRRILGERGRVHTEGRDHSGRARAARRRRR